MRTLNLKEHFINGWVVGDFAPSLINSRDVEVGVHFLTKGTRGDGHYHKVATEYNFITSGKVLIQGKVLVAGDAFVFEKLDKSELEFLEDTSLVVIKIPSVKNDKHYDTNSS